MENVMKFRLLVVLTSLFLVTACSKLKMENYDKLEVGMKYEQVVEIIGSPESCKEKLGTRRCVWGDPEATYIKASFISGTAMLFSHNKLN